MSIQPLRITDNRWLCTSQSLNNQYNSGIVRELNTSLTLLINHIYEIQLITNVKILITCEKSPSHSQPYPFKTKISITFPRKTVDHYMEDKVMWDSHTRRFQKNTNTPWSGEDQPVSSTQPASVVLRGFRLCTVRTSVAQTTTFPRAISCPPISPPTLLSLAGNPIERPVIKIPGHRKKAIKPRASGGVWWEHMKRIPPPLINRWCVHFGGVLHPTPPSHLSTLSSPMSECLPHPRQTGSTYGSYFTTSEEVATILEDQMQGSV